MLVGYVAFNFFQCILRYVTHCTHRVFFSLFMRFYPKVINAIWDLL